MFDRILGNYLVETGRISVAQLNEVFISQEENRVRLGVIAISEKLMTIEQVNEVNKMQAVMDKRFGDIAIEYRYLTEEQVNRLLNKQGNIYLVFIQTLLDKGFMTMEEVTSALESFQRKNSFTLTDMETLKSCDIERIVPVYFMGHSENMESLIAICIKTVARLLDYHVYFEKPVRLTTYEANNVSIQMQHGDHNIFSAIAGDDENLIIAGKAFAGEKFVDGIEDALDAMCEFINCVNGMFATKMSMQQVDVDMMPPEYHMIKTQLKGDELYKITLYICGIKIDYIMSFDKEIEIVL